MPTGILGSSQSLLGNIVLASIPSGLPSTVAMTALAYDSKHIIVQYSVPMSQDALALDSYTLIAISDPSNMLVPTMVSAAFRDAAQTAVVLTLADSLTYNQTYSLAVQGVADLAGDAEADAAYNFLATVPDPPRVLAAFVSGLHTIDVVFDRPVAPYNLGSITGDIYDADNLASFDSITNISWTSGLFPINNIRFTFSASPTASSFLIKINHNQNIQDVSFNKADDIAVLLTTAFRVAGPYSFSQFSQIQIVDGFVDRVSNDQFSQSYVNVYFNGKVLDSDATNTSNWSATQSGAHLIADTNDQVLTSNPVDLTTLIAFVTALQAGYNAHVANPIVHTSDDSALPNQSQIIRLTVALLKSYVAHTASPTAHLTPHPDLSTTSIPKTFNDAITVLNLIKAAFNTHIGDGSLHPHPDVYYTVTSSNASDLRSATVLADELRAKTQAHIGSPMFHVIADTINVPTASYVWEPTTFGTPTDLLTCAGAINELQDKYLAHAVDSSHLYGDNVNIFTSSEQYPTYADFLAANITNVADASETMRDSYNNHLEQQYAIPVQAIRNYASTGQCADLVDSFTYACVVQVGTTSLIPTITLTTTIHDESSISVTNPGDYTGSVAARPLAAAPALLSFVVFPDGLLTLRFDKEIRPQNVVDYSVSASSGVQHTIQSVQPDASVECLTQLITDIMTAYTFHLGTPGHKAIDSIHTIIPIDYPTGSLTSLIAAVNFFKSKLNFHASSALYHQFSSDLPVSFPDAIDAESAFQLAIIVRDAYLDHNSNLALHTSLAPSIVSAKGSDKLVLDMQGAQDGITYIVSVPARDLVINRAGTAPSSFVSFSIPFTGISSDPVLASAFPRTGLRVKPDGSIALESDDVLLFFSKPMDPSPPTLTFGAGIQVLQSSWVDDRTLDVQVSGMTTVSYTVSVSGLADTDGNPVNP